MLILLKSYKNDNCISHTVIIILLLNVLKGPLAYQIKTTTTKKNVYILTEIVNTVYIFTLGNNVLDEIDISQTVTR